MNKQPKKSLLLQGKPFYFHNQRQGLQFVIYLEYIMHVHDLWLIQLNNLTLLCLNKDQGIWITLHLCINVCLPFNFSRIWVTLSFAYAFKNDRICGYIPHIYAHQKRPIAHMHPYYPHIFLYPFRLSLSIRLLFRPPVRDIPPVRLSANTTCMRPPVSLSTIPK